jgi:hypothetical protein
MASRTTPTSVTVFGILDLVSGILNLRYILSYLADLQQIKNISQGLPKLAVWMPAQVAFSMLTSIALFVIGIGLLKRERWARELSVYLGVFVISFSIINALVIVAIFGRTAIAVQPFAIILVVSALFGVLLRSIYYGLMIYFLTRPAVKEAMD